MLYHPDKHRDPELKKKAEQLFNLVHRAYEGKSARRSNKTIQKKKKTIHRLYIRSILSKKAALNP